MTIPDGIKLGRKAQFGTTNLKQLNAGVKKDDMKTPDQIKLFKKFDKDGNAMFALADYYASQCEYEKAIEYYDLSFELDKENGAKPLYTDALEGMAMIYEIQGKYEEAIQCYDRTLKVLADAFGYTEGAPVDEVNAEKQRVINLMRAN